MQNFRTELFIDKNPDKITYNSKILALGSCFAQNISNKLRRYRFNVTSNPFGTIFNPLSVFRLLEICRDNQEIDLSLIHEQNGTWNHFNFHSKVAALSKTQLLVNIEDEVTTTRKILNESDTLIITFGSAFVYKLIENQTVVANCHKAPSTKFNKELLKVEHIVDGFRKIYHHLNHINNIILTVSPVRHVKDSITLNNVSKSVLRLACHEILNEFPHVKYFPAYEFLLDDLRDYRFYESDLLHPTASAQTYIFEKFVEAYMNEEDQKMIESVEKLIKATEHKPFNLQSEEYQKFVQETIGKMEQLHTKIDLTDMIDLMRKRLN